MNITKALIICIVALFQTVTLSNAAVHTTIAPRSNPQGYTLFTTAEKGCHDKQTDLCSPEFICTNAAYKNWARDNCQKTCNMCPGHIRTTPTLVERAKGGKTLLKSVTKAIYCNLALTKGCSYKGVHYQHNAQWKDGCKKCTCINGLYNCVEICPQYQWPNWPLGKSTRGCCPSHVIGVGDPVCNYGGKEYKQDETWSDGCQFSCVCNDGKAGQYQCRELCPKWDLPDVCHWNPAPPGKCCRQPECPPPYVITGYPDN